MAEQEARIKTPRQRKALPQRESLEPFWHEIRKGLALGYKKQPTGGVWIGRHFSASTGRRKTTLGAADDSVQANGASVLSFEQAEEAARQWAERLAQEDSGEVIKEHYTVGNAMSDYIADCERARRKRLDRTRSMIDVHILPALGEIELGKLRYGKIKAWRDALADSLPMLRTKPGSEQAYREIDRNDSEALRKRQATANRILTVLKAGLSHAVKQNHTADEKAWTKVCKFQEVDVPRVRYLAVDECKRLIDACPASFKALVRAALYSGCRYGELCAMRVDAFNRQAGTIHVERSKSGKGRYIPLTAEGAAFFESISADRSGDQFMFTHFDGRREAQPWEHSQQRYWMETACAEAGISPVIGFHILRHTYASQLALNGTPMPVIASLLGHADTRMTEKHYAHLAPSYVAETLRANLPSFGFESKQGPQLVIQSA